MSVLGALEIQLMADLARLRQDMNDAKSTVGSSMQAISQSVEMAKRALIGLTGIAGAAAFVGMIRGALDSAAALHDMSQATGASVEGLSALISVGKLSDTSAQTIAGSMNKLSKNLATVDEDSKGAAQAVKALGLNFESFRSLSPEQRMVALAGAMNNFADGGGKSAAAMMLMGKEGAAALPWLKDLATTGELQAKVTADQAAMADNFGDNLLRLKASGEGWKKELAMGMLPALDQTAQAFLDVMNGSGGLRGEVRRLSQDGSIAEWTRNAVEGLTYVADAGEYLWRVVNTVAQYIGALAGSAVATFSSVGDALTKLKSGDFSGAWESLKGGVRESDAVFKELDATIADTFGAPTMGAKLRARMGELQAVGATARETKPQLDMRAPLDSTTEAARKAKSQYDQLIAASKAQVAALQEQSEGGEQLTNGQKKLLELQSKIEQGTLEYEAASYRAAAAQLRLEDAEEQRSRQLQASTKWEEEARKANDATVEAIGNRTAQLRDELARELEANAAIGLSTTELAARTAASLRDQAAIADRAAAFQDEVDWSGRASAQLREQAALLRARADAAENGAVVKEAKAAADEWKKTTDSISAGLTDSIFRGLEAGTSLWDGFVNGLKNSISALVLKPTIEFAVRPIASAIGGTLGSLGIVGNASAATGGAGGGLGGALALSGGLGGLFTNFGGSVFNMTSSVAEGLGSDWLMSNAGNVADWANMGGSALGYLGALNSLSNGRYGSAAGAALGTAFFGPLGGLVGGQLGGWADSVFAGGAGTPHTGSVVGINGTGASTMWGDASQILNNYSAGTDKALRGAGGSSVAMLNALAGAFGGAANFSGLFKFAADGNDPSIGGINLSRGGSTLSDFGVNNGDFRHYAANGEEGFKTYLADLASATRDAMNAVGLPQWAKDTFSALGDSSTLEDIGKAVAQVTAMQSALLGLQQSIQPLGGVFDRVAGLSSDALVQLTQFAGGIDAFTKKVSGYVKNFYSDEEQAALTAAQVQKTLAAAGIDASMLTTKADYRGLVNGVDVSSEAGRRQLAALLDAADAFASIASALATSGGTLAGLAGLSPGDATLANLLTDQGNAAAAGPSSTDLLQTANDNLTAIASGTANTVLQLQALVAGQSAGNSALLERLLSLERALQDTLRPGYLGDLASDGGGS